MRRFAGKTAVVTGAGSGIGRAIALALASEGANVACADLNLDTAEATAREVRTAGVNALGAACDVSKADQVMAFSERVAAEMGSVDVLVNNAGVALGGPVEHLSLEDWAWLLGPNLWGVIHGVHAFLPAMLARGSGHIVNVASAAGLVGAGGMVSYCTSKFAVVGMSEALRFELASRGIGVTVVCPGFVDTKIVDSARMVGGVTAPKAFLKRISMKSDVLASLVLDGVADNDARVVATGHAKALVALKTHAPRLYDRVGRLMGRAFARLG